MTVGYCEPILGAIIVIEGSIIIAVILAGIIVFLDKWLDPPKPESYDEDIGG